MIIVVEITANDVAQSKADNQPALMYALGRAGFQNAYIDPNCANLHIVSATVSHLSAKGVDAKLAEDGTGFHHLELSKPDAVAFGLTVDDGLERRERDDLLNPTIEPHNETTAEAFGLLDNPSPERLSEYDGTNGDHEPTPPTEPAPSEPLEG